jgi:multiple sugar transport system ATP-binding protein
MGIRAENMETLAKPAQDALQVEVLVVEPLGSQNLLTVKIGDDLVKVATHPTFRVAPGDDVWLRFPAEKIRWVDRDSGRSVRRMRARRAAGREDRIDRTPATP